MNLKPILFNTDMVRAILDGRKTVTRRCVKFLNGKNPNWTGYIKDGLMLYNGTNEHCIKPCKYKSGDILYVRETWTEHYTAESDGKLVYCYKADGINLKSECLSGENNRWYPSIHMPKEAARIYLKVTDIRAERLCNMLKADFLSEGIELYKNDGRTEKTEIELEYEFEDLWNSTIKESDIDIYGWDASPWVWVIEFEICDKPDSV